MDQAVLYEKTLIELECIQRHIIGHFYLKNHVIIVDHNLLPDKQFHKLCVPGNISILEILLCISHIHSTFGPQALWK